MALTHRLHRMHGSPSLTRRELLRAGALGVGCALLPGTRSRAGAAPPLHRFLQINLEGGWDSAFATDPVIGTKIGSGTYEPVYLSSELAPQGVPGKPALMVGPGLAGAVNAFARIPTAFVNGVFMEVSGHDFAQQYMSSGILSLSNSRDYPAIPAILGAASQGFPAHVVIGTAAPLGDTRFTSPPLQAFSIGALTAMINGPSGALVLPGLLADHYNDELVADAHALIDGLDGLVVGRSPASVQRDLAPWRESTARIEEIYAKKIGDALTASEEVATRYGFEPGSVETGPENQLAAALLLLQSDLTPYLTMTFGSFDSHTGQLDVHLPLMQRFARALDVFVGDLLTTDDPAAPGQKLADTTTIYITSEFVRTPSFSILGGTEHWPSASAILLGRGIQDGAVIGATGDNAEALGWDPDLLEAVAFSDTTQLLPDHLIATMLANIAGEDVVGGIPELKGVPLLSGLFVSKS